MSRAALLSTCGDVFILTMCLNLWKKYWYDEVDHFYVNFNNHCKVPDDVVGEFCERWASEPKLTIIYHPDGISNGPPQVELTKICNEDLILLLEDDGFIFTKGKVSECFKRIESGEVDALGSPRFSCGAQVADLLKVKYDLDYSGLGDKGPNFWPNFFFCKKASLMLTDLDFGSHEFKANEYNKFLGGAPTETEYGDTFVWACIQLRALGVRFGDIPQFHVHPLDDGNKFELFENPYWLHGGSLSSGWGGYLSGQVPDTFTDMSKQEIESRVAFWMIASDTVHGYEAFKQAYKAGIDTLIKNAYLDKDRINKKYNLYAKTIFI